MADVEKARRTSLGIRINNVDMTDDINSRLISATFTDNEDGEADDFEMTLEDRDGEVVTAWLDKEIAQRAKANRGGASKCEIIPTIYQKNWEADGEKISLKCGTFALDDVQSKGPPEQVTMKATACDQNNAIRKTKRTKTWKKTTLKKIAGVIANRANYSLLYLYDSEVSYKKVTQRKKTDMSFLQRLCTRAELSLKVTDGKIVIFDQRSYEDKTETRTIRKGDGSYSTYSLQASLSSTCYSSCTVKYTDPLTGKTYEGTYSVGSSASDSDSASSDDDSQTSGESVTAKFTAYYPANNSMEGGYYDAYDNLLQTTYLDKGVLEVAGPKSCLKKKIQISGTGTKYDGQTAVCMDTGGAMKILTDGTYRFDILMSTNSQCEAFGVKYGKAKILSGSSSGSSSSKSSSSSSSSSSRKDIVDYALSYIGSYGSDNNKFSQAIYGGACQWCHCFVSYCARQAGVSTSVVPSTASTDTGMAFFKRKGQFKYKGSYTPKRGDICYFKTGASHVAIVVSATSSSVTVVEGNTSGDEVKKNTYTSGSSWYAKITGYGTPDYSYIKSGSSSSDSSSGSSSTSDTENSLTISFKMQLNTHLGCKPITEYKKLRKYQRTGKALNMYVGEKKYGYGKWLISSLSFAGDHGTRKGNWSIATVSVALTAYE